MIDKTRVDTFMQKKGICVATADLNTEATGEKSIGVTSENFLLFKLPDDAVIVNAYTHVIEASDAATSAAATIGTTDGGAELATGIDMKATGEQGTFVGQVLTDTGVDVYLNVTISGAATAGVGKFLTVVEYIEFDKNTGEYTEVTRAFA